MTILLSRPLFMTSIITVLGLAMSSIWSQAPAEAALFKIYGKLASQPTETQNEPNVYGETGFFDGTNGFFDGTIDIDNTNGFSAKTWSVKVYDTSGDYISFDNEYPNLHFYETSNVSLSNFSDHSLISFDYYFEVRRPGGGPNIGRDSLNLFIDKPNFNGNITSESFFSDFRKPYYIPESDAPFYTINVVNGYVTSVPEPLTFVGTAVAGVMGWSMKRRQKASK